MPKVRPKTTNQTRARPGSGWGDSRAKAGVWFSEKAKFKAYQKKVLAVLKDELDWVAVKDVIMVVNQKTPGIVLIAPNPSLPGVIVLSNGVSDAGTAKLQSAMEKRVAAIAEELGVSTERPAKKPTKK
jgi:hypothetical protein